MRWVVLVFVAACSKPSAEVAKHEDRHEVPTAPSKLTLAITIGADHATWGEAAFAGVPKLAGKASDGEARDTWSLRELVHKNVGPSARVVAVVSGASRTAIEAAAWDDAAHTPILHTTKRGTLKYRLADPDGKWGDTLVKDVTGLEIAR